VTEELPVEITIVSGDWSAEVPEFETVSTELNVWVARSYTSPENDPVTPVWDMDAPDIRSNAAKMTHRDHLPPNGVSSIKFRAFPARIVALMK
jgi:hypothetical protein